MKSKVALIAMGCEKNVINSEQMLYLLDRAGYTLVGDPDAADVTVINTCGFTGDARREALEQIAEVAGTESKIIIAGCYAEFLKRERATAAPIGTGLYGPKSGLRPHGYVGAGRFDDIVGAVQAVLDGQTPLYFGNVDAPVSETPRIHMGPAHTATLKIAEGCDNHCAYCVIPALRGPYRSRRPEAVWEEARTLCGQGATELVVIAQDVTRYGMDGPGGARLPELLEGLCKTEGLRRLRLHYLYPDLINERLIDTIAAQPKIAKYLDIPIQHASDRLLAAMNRRYTRTDLEALIAKLRERVPGVVLRTSIMVGFPGETAEDVDELLDFLLWARIPRAGVFVYSREAGTAAAALPGHVAERTARHRQKRVERLQSRMIDAFNREREGQTVEVLTEGYDGYVKLYYGRSGAESPEVDGVIFFTSDRPVAAGEWVRVRLTGAMEGDGKGACVP